MPTKLRRLNVSTTKRPTTAKNVPATKHLTLPKIFLFCEKKLPLLEGCGEVYHGLERFFDRQDVVVHLKGGAFFSLTICRCTGRTLLTVYTEECNACM